MRTADTQVVVVGAGAAGLYTALCAARQGAAVTLVSATPLAQSSSYWAQGGLAAALGQNDSPARHLADTVAAGRGAVRESAARVLCEGARAAVEDLAALGIQFDADRDGNYALGLEGGHSARRVVHAGGAATGRRMIRRLSALVSCDQRIEVLERRRAIRILTVDGRAGAVALHDDTRLTARAIVLATGGAAALWSRTTNPAGAIGGGLLLAFDAGAELADLELMQFHPTAVVGELDDVNTARNGEAAGRRGGRPNRRAGMASGRQPDDSSAARSGEPGGRAGRKLERGRERGMPTGADGFLVSEAVRGEGARLLDASGERFVDELAPRDEVARAVQRQIEASGRNAVGLDMRDVNPALFPNVVSALRRAGIDPERELIPVAPAAHYMMGGVATDLEGRSTLPGLYAVGECACTGLHGANRLASNSLSECFVFGARAARAAAAEPPDGTPTAGAALGDPPRIAISAASRAALWRYAGLERSGDGLRALSTDPHPLVRLIARSALTRQESRGAHQRTDFPARDPALDGIHVTLLEDRDPVTSRWI